MPSKDLFEPVPEFLAAFENILKNGFFEGVNFSVGGHMMEGQIHSCSFVAWGCVPDHKKFRAAGSGAILDPKAIVASCRSLAKQKKLTHIQTSVETEPWPLWDSKGENIVGSKGQRTKLSFHATFKI